MADKEFHALKIEVGMLLEVLGDGSEVLFRARVRDFDGEFVHIVHHNGGKLPPAIYGTEYKLRGFLPDHQTAFYHATVCGSTDTVWKLGELSCFTGERREYFRQNISVEALVKRISLADDTSVREGAVACQLLDVSGGGISVLCRAAYSVGDRLMVGNAQFTADSEPFSFQCTVRRARETPDGFLYGCQFEHIRPGEQDRLIRAIFLLQREEAKRLRERE